MTALDEISDDELRRAAAVLMREIREPDLRALAIAELVRSVPTRRGNMAGFVIPVLAQERLLDGVFPQHGFVWLVLASSCEELEEALQFA